MERAMRRALASVLLATSGFAQQAPPTIRSTAEEVILDVIVRDKRGREIRDLEAKEIEVYDNGVKRDIRSLRLVQGIEAIEMGEKKPLDPLRQVRLVTLVFESLSPDGRRLAKQAATDFIKDQAQNVFYAVFVAGQQLAVLQEFTRDRDKLKDAIEKATSGAQLMQFTERANVIREQLQRQLGAQNAGRPDEARLSAPTPVVTPPSAGGAPPVNPGDFVQAKMAETLLNMIDFQQSIDTSERSRAAIYSLMSLARGLTKMPGRKTVLYFSEWLQIPQQLQPEFESVISLANRSNVSFYTLDARGLQTYGDTSAAGGELSRAVGDIRSAVTRDDGRVSAGEITAMERGENASRVNPVTSMRTLAEGTGGFLISNTNDFRRPLGRVSEEINSYYEIAYNPGIEKYDGTFRRVLVKVNRQDVDVHARNGYFALPGDVGGQAVFAFEVPLLESLAATPVKREVEFRSAALHLDPAKTGSGRAAVILEVPMRSLKFTVDETAKTYRARLSFVALLKDQTGNVIRKFSRDLPLQGSTEQLEGMKTANFIFREQLSVAPGRYTLESAVMDREAEKIGVRKVAFVMAPKPRGVALSNIALVRRFEANAQNLDASEPFQFQGGRITPTLVSTIPGGKGASLSMFFIVYPDPEITEKPQVIFEYLQDGNVVGRGSVELPPADGAGRIPYVMSSPVEAMKPGMYEIRAVVKQGASAAEERTFITIE